MCSNRNVKKNNNREIALLEAGENLTHLQEFSYLKSGILNGTVLKV